MYKLTDIKMVCDHINFKTDTSYTNAYGYFSFCLTSCNLGILKNRTNYFSNETSICQFSNMASSGLKKMFILTILYTHKSVSVNMFLIICFSFSWWQMFCHIIGWCYPLADVIASLCCGRCETTWADVIAHILSNGRCYCHCLCGRW